MTPLNAAAYRSLRRLNGAVSPALAIDPLGVADDLR
ncbi:hypothetical protein FHS34_001478 [Streptomyces echinatus]|uniref:Uncharacterized protein n=1 Tax=Streptomyces echinatus TaxID=67293 RepID=A0A7W9UQ09_9ACTN|nr:hypothetical protein [Streptomyces echinatus]